MIPPNVPEPPSFLSAYARDEWWRVAPGLHRLGLLAAIDVMPLSAYCMAYSRWRTAEEILARLADSDTMNGLLVKTGADDVRRNPLVKISADSAADMIRYAGEFGLTPVARSRLVAGVNGQPPSGGKFDGLLG